MYPKPLVGARMLKVTEQQKVKCLKFVFLVGYNTSRAPKFGLYNKKHPSTNQQSEERKSFSNEK